MGGNTKGQHRRFGSVRQLPSGRWQARYQDPDGLLRSADQTFPTKTMAERWLTTTEADVLNSDWIDPQAGRVAFRDYATTWLEERPGLRPATVRSYSSVLNRHVLPTFGSKSLSDIREPHVRRWYKLMLNAGVGTPTVAKAYVLLKAIFATAVDDGLIRRNPCQVKGGGSQQSPERPVPTIRQIYDLAEAVGARYRALVLLAAFCSLRWGELAALRRADIDLRAHTVKVERTLDQLSGGGHSFGPPKSAAGHRTVIIPDLILTDLASHLASHAGPGEIDLVFTSPAARPCITAISANAFGFRRSRQSVCPVFMCMTFATLATSWSLTWARTCGN